MLFLDYLKTRNPQPLEELVRRHQHSAYRIAWSITRNEALAEEALQEVFVLMLRQGRRFQDQGQGAFRAWFLKLVVVVARNRRRSEWRSQQRSFNPNSQGRSADAARWQEDEQHAGQQDAKQMLEAALAELPSDFRLPIVLHYLAGLSQREVARNLEVSASLVCRRISLGLDQLRRQLARSGLAIPAEALVRSLQEFETPALSPNFQVREADLRLASQNPAFPAPTPALKQGLARAAVWPVAALAAVLAAALAFRSPRPPPAAPPLAGLKAQPDSSGEAPGSATPALPWRWSFEAGPPLDLRVMAGGWTWRPPTHTAPASMATAPGGVTFLLPFEVPAQPILILVSGQAATREERLFGSVNYFSGQSGEILPRRLWRSARLPSLDFSALSFQSYLLGRYIVSTFNNNKLPTVAEYSSTRRRVALSLANMTVFSFEIRALAPKELPPELRDLPALIKRLGLVPQLKQSTPMGLSAALEGPTQPDPLPPLE